MITAKNDAQKLCGVLSLPCKCAASSKPNENNTKIMICGVPIMFFFTNIRTINQKNKYF